MSGHLRSTPLVLGLMVFGLLLGACTAQRSDAAPPAVAPSSDVLDEAAAQATAIVREAQATALVLKAQAQATAVMAQASTLSATPTPAPTLMVQPPAAGQPSASPTPAPGQVEEQEPPPQQAVEVLRVGFAGEGGLIHVQFLAPPEVAEKWWQGAVSVIDEDSGATYSEIPVMPKIGPLIGRPKRQGQLGYVMLVNVPPYLRPGALVTVVLGNYTFEHVSVGQ